LTYEGEDRWKVGKKMPPWKLRGESGSIGVQVRRREERRRSGKSFSGGSKAISGKRIFSAWGERRNYT